MPFRLSNPSSTEGKTITIRKETQHHHHNTHTIVREVPIVNASLDSLTVGSIRVLNDIVVPNRSTFYPPTPSFVELQSDAESVVGFRVDKTPFLVFDTSANELHTVNMVAESGHFQNLHVQRLTTSVTDFGSLLVKNGNLYVPENANVGNHFIAGTGSVGGVQLHNRTVTSLEMSTDQLNATSISCDILNTARIHCEAPYITMGGVRLLSGDVEARELRSKDAHIQHCILGDLECGSISSMSDKLSVSTGIETPPESSNVLGCLRISKQHVDIEGVLRSDVVSANTVETESISTKDLQVWGSGTIADVQLSKGEISATRGRIGGVLLSQNSLDCMEVKTGILKSIGAQTESLFVGDDIILEDGSVRAKDFRLKDGTSILNGVFPPGMIMMFHGKVAPRGWMECNGKCGTPLLTPPSPEVIYIVRR
jgi:hypothetical protein